MTFFSTVTVEFGDKAGLNDISDRVQGAQISSRVRVGDFGTNRVIVTLRNDDGALTPGGGGTYENIDWFSQALFIEGDTGTYSFDLFHGIISNFEIQDDGVNSTVVLEADDGFSVGGGSNTQIVPITTGDVDRDIGLWILALYNGYTSAPLIISGVDMPLLANTTSSVSSTNAGIESGTIGFGDFSATAPARDFLRRTIMPSSLNVAWPTKISLTTTNTEYNAYTCEVYPVRNTGTRIDYTFSQNATSGELPFRNLERGFAIDALLNQCALTSLPDWVSHNVYTPTRSNAQSLSKYGVRTIEMNQIAVGKNNTGNMKASTIAERWANTFSASEFSVREFTVTEAMVRAKVGTSAASEEKWAQLLDIETGPVQVGTIEFTPAGSSTAITEAFVVMSRTIQITPEDIRLTVECLPIDQTGAFVLDDSTLGVLDQNRLG